MHAFATGFVLGLYRSAIATLDILSSDERSRLSVNSALTLFAVHPVVISQDANGQDTFGSRADFAGPCVTGSLDVKVSIRETCRVLRTRYVVCYQCGV